MFCCSMQPLPKHWESNLAMHCTALGPVGLCELSDVALLSHSTLWPPARALTAGSIPNGVQLGGLCSGMSATPWLRTQLQHTLRSVVAGDGEQIVMDASMVPPSHVGKAAAGVAHHYCLNTRIASPQAGHSASNWPPSQLHASATALQLAQHDAFKLG